MTSNASPPCPVSDTDLLAYRDSELAPARDADLARHIADCTSCKERLRQAELLTATLLAGSPLRDEPTARAALHDRLAAGSAAWWQRRAMLSAAMPVAVLLLVVIAANRWLREDDCASCPPPPTQMQVTAFSGIPAGWASLLPCPIGPAPKQATLPAPTLATGASSPLGLRASVFPADKARRDGQAASGDFWSQGGVLARPDRRDAVPNPACGVMNQARQPGRGALPPVGAIVMQGQPGS